MEYTSEENALGRIAKTYEALHGLHHLRKAREWAVGRPSNETAVRSIFQAVEVALLNLSDLTQRATHDLAANKVSRATTKLVWALSFHRLIATLAQLPARFSLMTGDRVMGSSNGGFRASPALAGLLLALRDFDATVADWAGERSTTYESLIKDVSVSGVGVSLVHQVKVAAHAAEIWDTLLVNMAFVPAHERYRQWVCADELRAMVYDVELKDESYYMQFRALHQIPEILALEANAHFAAATQLIMAGDFRTAHDHLLIAVALTDGVVASLTPLVDCLTTGDYHFFRGNLGLNSGTYSNALNDALLYHQYGELTKALAKWVQTGSDRPNSADSGENTTQAPINVDSKNEHVRELQLLVSLAGIYRSQLIQWRDHHLALPRHNLGTGNTASMIGNLNGVQTVERLRDAAESRDRKDPLWKAMGDTSKRERGILGDYLNSADSLYFQLQAATGTVTRERFPDVQARSGAAGCPFKGR